MLPQHYKKYSLDSLNSATKYPSIPTLHKLGDKGILTDELNIDLSGETFYVTEKIDGTNCRIIVFSDGSYMIGSREELLYASGDYLRNPALGIVDAVKHFADGLSKYSPPGGRILVYYGEVFGGKVTSGSKNYTTNGETDFSLFDVAELENTVMNNPPEMISRWRDQGGQKFWDAEGLKRVKGVRAVPYIDHSNLSYLSSQTHADTLNWMRGLLPETRAIIGPGALKRPEGVVIRTPDRRKIAKVRFEDYERTVKHNIRVAKSASRT